MTRELALELRGICFAVAGNKILNDASLEVSVGESVAVVGPSGSGKSTLLAIAGLILGWQQGDVYLSGRRYEHPPRKATAMISWIPQQALILHGRTVLENCLLSVLHCKRIDARTIERAEEVLDRVGLLSASQRNASVLSGGELQRLALARAALSGSSIVIADEPTASLDRAAADSVAQCLEQLATESALLVATHDPIVAGRCDRVVRLEGGMLHS